MPDGLAPEVLRTERLVLVALMPELARVALARVALEDRPKLGACSGRACRRRGRGRTVYRFGRRHLGHLHPGDDGLADFSFPREVRDELIRSRRAIPHLAFSDSRTSASYRQRSGEDMPGP